MDRGTREKDVEAVIIKREDDLIAAIESKKKIRFDTSVFNSLLLKNLSKHATVSKLLEIISNDPLPILEFGLEHEWSDKELKTLSTIIANSKAITRIEFNGATNAVKTIFEALESNTSIKEIVLVGAALLKQRIRAKFFEKLCHGLITKNINVETFELSNFNTTLSMEDLDPVLEALKSTKSFRSLKFNDSSALFEYKASQICEICLTNKRITSFLVDSYSMPTHGVPALLKIIQDNNIKQLHLRDFEERYATIDLVRAFIDNTSITDLDISYFPIDPMVLAEIFEYNKSLLKINCVVKKYPEGFEDTILDALEKNTSLTDLCIVGVKGIEKVLLTNKTLKCLRLAKSDTPINGDLTNKILRQNKTLTLLDLRVYKIETKDMDAIIEALEYNTTLQSFSCNIETQNEVTRRNFCAVISNHQSLTHMETQYQSNLSILRMVLPGFSEMVEEALEKNRSLRSWSPFDTFEQFQHYFKRNIKIQEYNTGATKTIIRMIRLKPHSFMLPIEIWSMIFDQLHYPGVNIKFGELFHSDN